MANNLRFRFIIFFAVLVVGFIFLFPSIKLVTKALTGKEITPQEMVAPSLLSRPIGLGLDLSGGVHLVYEVQTSEAVKGRLQGLVSSIKSELREKKSAVTKSSVNSKNQIELSFLSQRSKDLGLEVLQKNYSNLVKISEINSGEQYDLVLGLSPTEVASIENSAVDQSLEKLRNRVDQFGVTEPLIQRQGGNRILFQMPGLQDSAEVKKIVGKVAKLEFRVVSDLPNAIALKDQNGAVIKVSDTVEMTGDAVANAAVGFSQTGEVEVNLTLNPQGAKTFAAITTNNVRKQLAIILDGVVYSAPVINEPITSGACQISGRFKVEEAKNLALVLRSGALPAPLNIIEEQVVGPSLGKDSQKSGILAIALGFAMISTFMVWYYKKAGVIALICLALNLFLVLACLSAFGATLSLPGLAGLALTIGMAVDSNVIIFERIKEELRAGGSKEIATELGFEKALTAIIDSNITTFLSGIILFYFGSGAIRGFAVTLCIGIITTIYCATFASKLLFEFMNSRSAKKEMSI